MFEQFQDCGLNINVKCEFIWRLLEANL